MLTVHYGGTFDPIHNGHLAIARTARDVLQAPVALLPAADPPHRPAPGASAPQRARMLELAIAGEPGLGVDLRELRRSGPSYTVDTLQELRDEHGPDAPLVWLIGEDSLRSLDRWHRWTALFELAHLAVAARAGGGLDAGLPPAVAQALGARGTGDPKVLARSPAGRILPLEQPLRAESATAVRALRGRGDAAWRAVVPAAVAAFIDERGLYLDTTPPPVRYNPGHPIVSIECPLSNQAHVIKTRLPDPAPPVDQLLVHVREAVEELKGKDAVEIDVRGKTSVADYMVVVSGTSTRHVKSIADEVVKFSKKLGVMPLGVEGEREAEWVLVDLGDVIVHVMLPRVREFYALERLWTVGDQPGRDDE